MAIDTDRAALHALVDALPPERFDEAKAIIGALADPVQVALLTAPPEDEALSPEELATLDAVGVERAAGAVMYVSGDELARRLGE